jgi:hypothetical protein
MGSPRSGSTSRAMETMGGESMLAGKTDRSQPDQAISLQPSICWIFPPAVTDLR